MGLQLKFEAEGEGIDFLELQVQSVFPAENRDALIQFLFHFFVSTSQASNISFGKVFTAPVRNTTHVYSGDDEAVKKGILSNRQVVISSRQCMGLGRRGEGDKTE